MMGRPFKRFGFVAGIQDANEMRDGAFFSNEFL